MSPGPSLSAKRAASLDDDAAEAIGRELRAMRQKRGEDLYDLADLLRIKPSYLFALEEGDYAVMPGMPYALGFLRTYAQHLGLDAGALIGRLRAVPGVPARPAALVVPLPPVERRRPTLVIALALLLLGTFGYGGWSYVIRPGLADAEGVLPPPAGTGMVVAIPPAEPLPSPPPLMALDATQSPAPVVPAPAVPAAPPPPVPMPPAAAPAPPVTPASGPVTVAAAPDAPRPAPIEALPRPAQNVGEAAASEARVVLVATENAWIQVRSPDRAFTKTRLMQAGERFPLPDRTDLALWTGNAGGLQILLDGNNLGALGTRGAVIKNIPLDPAHLASRTSVE